MTAGAPKGNKNAKGHGRKSAYQEKADATYLFDLFFKKHTRKEIVDMVSEAGKHSMSDAWLAKGLAGNVPVLQKVFDKLFPDKAMLDITSMGKQLKGPLILPEDKIMKFDK